MASSIRVLQTVEHRCGYYADRRTRNLVVDPGADHLDIIYDSLTSSGFRRAGALIFRPHCRNCTSCLATRIPVAEFVPSRSQRRTLERNADFTIDQSPARFTTEIFALYRRYLRARHPGGGMDNPAREDFENFLLSSWSRSFFVEVRNGRKLLAVAVTDRLSSGLSAVYTFFEPGMARHSLGVLAILTQISLARSLRLPYVYLGYWIKDHPKMQYKVDFRPIEVFQDGQWLRHGD